MRFLEVNNYSEQDQRQLFINLFDQNGSTLHCEIPVFCRSVDLVELNGTKQTISAIEFKKTNWKKAIEQVKEVSTSFDYLSICVLKPKTEKSKNLIVNVCDSDGIGLIFFNKEKGTFENAVTSKRVHRTWEVQKQNVIKYLTEANKYDK